MIEYKKVFIDTAPFIYCIEESKENPRYYSVVQRFFDNCYKKDIMLATSTVTVEEYCVMPYRTGELQRIALFQRFIWSIGIEVINIDEKIADKAAQIRAKYKSFKAMDALQLATACVTKCDLFLTNDKQLRQFGEMKCITVEEL